MPWFLRDNCVVKGTKENPGETIKCHETKAKARAHLRALYANVEDVMLKGLAGFSNATAVLRDIGFIDNDEYADLSVAIMSSMTKVTGLLDVLNLRSIRALSPSMMNTMAHLSRMNGNDHFIQYRSLDVMKDRWLAVSTREEWDREGEMFTKEAMDFDIRQAYRTNEFPEFRMYHVRGFKLGMCDKMTRNGNRAVDEGFWHKTKFAQAVKDIVVRNTGRWKISRGFYSLEATGFCRRCNKDLIVRPINYTLGIMCPKCRMYHPNASLNKLKHLKAKTFDITVTDVPAVASTAVAAYSVS
jgi:hypothetical protein